MCLKMMMIYSLLNEVIGCILWSVVSLGWCQLTVWWFASGGASKVGTLAFIQKLNRNISSSFYSKAPLAQLPPVKGRLFKRFGLPNDDFPSTLSHSATSSMQRFASCAMALCAFALCLESKVECGLPKVIWGSFMYLAVNSKCLAMNSKCVAMNSKCLAMNSKCLAMNSKYVTINSKCIAINSKCLAMSSKCVAMNSKCVAINSK